MGRFVLLFAACFPLFAAAAEPELKGELNAGGEAVPLGHILVLDFDDAEGMGDGPELRILLSDRKVDPTGLEAPILFGLDARAREGALRGVLLRFDPKGESREVYGTVYAAMGNPQSSMPFFTLGGSAGGVDSLALAEGVLTGSVAHGAEGDPDFGIPAYSFTATFRAPVTKATPATVLQGQEGMDSAPMKAYIRFEEALASGDLDTVRKMTTPERVQQLEAYIAEVGKEAFLEMVKQMAPDPAMRAQNLQGVFVRGEVATIVFKEEGGKTSTTLRKKGEDWTME
ncbi:MAG: hypothetical protein KF886_14125 [Candidatus Hydrogenedentes bacterium]|nr:hypothetical protein [Candidatus Hydrogenedentota bacterium]